MYPDTIMQAFLDYYFEDEPPPPPIPATAHLGLHVGVEPPNGDGSGFIEPGGGAYQRMAITSADFWGSAFVPEFGDLAGQVIKQNVQVVTWPEATGPWGTPTHVGVFSAATGGDPLAMPEITEGQIAIVSGVQVRFTAGRITLIGRRF